jgi:hypothetical protein
MSIIAADERAAIRAGEFAGASLCRRSGVSTPSHVPAARSTRDGRPTVAGFLSCNEEDRRGTDPSLSR